MSRNNSKARVLNPREILARRGLLSKGANLREMLVGFLRDFPQLHNQESAKRMELPLEELKAPMEVHFADWIPHPTKL
jgi:hypothetical protein